MWFNKDKVTVYDLLEEASHSFKYRAWCSTLLAQAVFTAFNLIWWATHPAPLVSMWWCLVLLPTFIMAATSEPSAQTPISDKHQTAILELMPQDLRAELASIVVGREKAYREDDRIDNTGRICIGHVTDMLKLHQRRIMRTEGNKLLTALKAPDS